MSRGLGDVYKRQLQFLLQRNRLQHLLHITMLFLLSVTVTVTVKSFLNRQDLPLKFLTMNTVMIIRKDILSPRLRKVTQAQVRVQLLNLLSQADRFREKRKLLQHRLSSHQIVRAAHRAIQIHRVQMHSHQAIQTLIITADLSSLTAILHISATHR